ncbi:phosphotransferase [Nocardioides sp.]|uniref:phosphotransferase n=1 Tax=Nocardioides sp. TaxID=35761 RepID=UPI002ED45C47
MSSPRPSSRPSFQPVPGTADTARRLEWRFLPPTLRAGIEQQLGSPVVSAESRNRGFTPGFASVLTCEDGTRHFVKAASTNAQPLFARAYREEARKLAGLPDTVPAPRLQWVLDDEWLAIGIEYVDGRHPARPWRAEELDACLDALEIVADQLTPPSPELDLGTAAAELGPFFECWEGVRELHPELAHVDEAEQLAARYAEVVAGETVVHTDVRDDNALIDRDGKVWFCDWNWPVVGAPWLDSLFMLIGPRGDGVDVDAVIKGRPLLRDVPAEDVDSVIALVTAYFLKSAAGPVPPTSPYLRDFQRWQGEVCWAWLCERRGWT